MEWNKGSLRSSNGDGSQGGKKQSHPTKLHGWKNALFITIQGKQLSVCGIEIKRKHFFPNTWQRGFFDNGRVAISLCEDMFFVFVCLTIFDMYLRILTYVNKYIVLFTVYIDASGKLWENKKGLRWGYHESYFNSYDEGNIYHICRCLKSIPNHDTLMGGNLWESWIPTHQLTVYGITPINGRK